MITYICKLTTLFIIARKEKRPKRPSSFEWITNGGISLQWNLILPYKGTRYWGRMPATRREPENSSREGRCKRPQTVWIRLHKISKIVKLTENRLVNARDREWWKCSRTLQWWCVNSGQFLSVHNSPKQCRMSTTPGPCPQKVRRALPLPWHWAPSNPPTTHVQMVPRGWDWPALRITTGTEKGKAGLSRPKTLL